VVRNRTYGDPCGVARSLDVIGERWALLVVRELLLGPKRFADLLAGLPGASPNVVSQRLRDLTQHGVVRRVELGPPARIHLYELTEWGHELEPALLHLGRWGARAPRSERRRLGIDSLILSIKAAFDTGRTPGRSSTYELRVDDHIFSLGLTEGALDVRRGNAPGPDATITTSHDALEAMVTGERTLADVLRTGELRLKGDRDAVAHAKKYLLAST
jgi:DNA-binding HxlR family transcriptional regulator/putative sterol carrier protein